MIASPGMVIAHQALVMYCRASDSISPQEMSGCWMPRPRNDSDASNRITCPTWSVASTTSVLKMFGSKWRMKITGVDTPATRAKAM